MLNILASSHSVSILAYHIVLVTKYRLKEISQKEMYIVKAKAEEISMVKEIGFEKDHIHLLIQASPSLSVAEIIKHIKVESTKEIRKENKNWTGWKRGYFASSVSEMNLEVVDEYIKNQGGTK